MTRNNRSCLLRAASLAALLVATQAPGKSVQRSVIDPLRDPTATVRVVDSRQLREELKRVPLDRFSLTLSVDTLSVDGTATAELVVRPGARLLSMLATAQESDGSAPPPTTVVLKATLDGGFGVNTDPVGEETKAVRAETDARWRWNIEAKKTGTHTLTASITTPLTQDGVEAFVDVRSLAASLVVIPAPVSAPAAVPFSTRLLAFFSGNWQWLWAAILVPAAGWFWNRRKTKTRRRRSG